MNASDGFSPGRGARRPLSLFDLSGFTRRAAACLPALALAVAAAFGFAASAQAQTSDVLVSNRQPQPNRFLPVTAHASPGVGIAQGFTTGSNSLGYRLTAVEWEVETGPALAVTIRSGSSSGCGTATPNCPGDVVGTLRVPVGLPANTALQWIRFTAPGGGIDLAPGTTYWVVVEAQTAAGWRHRAERLGTTDPGGAPGWDLGGRAVRGLGSTGVWTLDIAWEAVATSIHGYAKRPSDTTPPRVSGTPSVSGDTLTLGFDERLRDGSVPAAAFEVVVEGGEPAHPANVAVSERTVTLTLAAAVAHGEAVQVRYTRPASGERLRDAAGNAVADFTRPVTNESTARRPTADAGTDRTALAGARVRLSGSGADPDGEDAALAYAWTQTAGEAVTLTGADTARPVFTAPDAPGALAFRLAVTDPGGLTGVDAVTVTVMARSPERTKALERALAAVGAQTLAGALDTIGARFADAAPETDLTLAGRRILSAPPAGAGGSCPGGAFGREGCGAALRERIVSLGELLGASAFS